MSSRSCSERSRVTSAAVSVIGVSARNVAHSAREKVRYGESVSSMRWSIVTFRCAMSGPRARRLLVKAGDADALRQRGLHLVERYGARLEQNQKMIKQIGRFGDQPLAAFTDRRQRGLDRLLAELLGAMRHALVEQLARIGGLGTRGGALFDAGRQVVEGEARHEKSSSISAGGWAAKSSCVEPHRQPGGRHVALGFAHIVLAEMEDRRGKHRGRVAVADALDEMLERADAPRGDHRHGDGVRERAREREV